MKREKKLIICPHCEIADGKKKVLAERLPSGILAIKRSYGTGQEHLTLIAGKNLQIICGDCATVVYHKKA